MQRVTVKRPTLRLSYLIRKLQLALKGALGFNGFEKTANVVKVKKHPESNYVPVIRLFTYGEVILKVVSY